MENTRKAPRTPSRPMSRPTVDPEQIKEANRLREKLESLGVWGNKGSRVRNPYYPLPPESETRRQSIQNSSQLQNDFQYT